jgi:glutamate synthase (NADPH/NADH) small chain
MGIEIHYFVAPVEILGPERVRGVRCRRTRLSSQCDDSGRPIPVELEGTEYLLEADTVIPAIGQVPGDGFLDLFERGSRGYLKVDGSFATSRPKVFAGGDLIGGEGTVVQSVGHGTEAARAIHRFLSGDKR